MNSQEIAMAYFLKWRSLVSARQYDRWCEHQEEEASEQQYAEKFMEPVYWCWQCKHGDCERHTL